MIDTQTHTQTHSHTDIMKRRVSDDDHDDDHNDYNASGWPMQQHKRNKSLAHSAVRDSALAVSSKTHHNQLEPPAKQTVSLGLEFE